MFKFKDLKKENEKFENLKKSKNLPELAALLGYKPQALSYILYKISENSKYTIFSIPKKTGGERIIKAPKPKIKELQKRLAKLLLDCFKVIHFDNFNKLPCHGFLEKHSIYTNAFKHKNKRYVFNIDLKDFFPSINFGRVRGFFIRDKFFQLNPKIATLIAQIACHNNELPQGSPTSPIISNLIARILDIRLVKLAKANKCFYTRYADDLTFSTNQKEFPDAIATLKNNNWEVGNLLKKEIEKSGFKINPQKISMQYKNSRQMVTGLIVNKKLNVKREYYKTVRAMCHELFTKGEFYFKDEKQNDKKKGNINQLEGMLNFIYQTKFIYSNNKKKNNKQKHFQQIQQKENSFKELYKDFLFYKYFWALNKPLILTEGETDIIYLKCALKKLANLYPKLISYKQKNQYVFNITFLKKTPFFNEIMGIGDGAGGLKNLLNEFNKYKEKKKKFLHKQNYPIFVIVDNDNGGKGVKHLCSNINHENIHLIVVPEDEENKTIEDLFEPEILNIQIDGKIFNKNKDFDNRIYYGKKVFAKQIINKKWKEINFDKFKPIFDVIVDIISKYPNLNEP